MSSFEDHVLREIKTIRETLQELEDISEFEVTISASGRVHDGDILIEYKVDHLYKSHVSATANDLESALHEFIRRFEWKQRNQPKAISFQPTRTLPAPENDDKIPF